MSTAVVILARSGEGWKSGPIGLAVILALCVAVYFLFKSMSKHLRKVREEFPGDDTPQSSAPVDPPAPLGQSPSAPKPDSAAPEESPGQAP
jgi:hypothetical protein